MPMLLGTKGSDILSWHASQELVARLKERLTGNWELISSETAQSFLEQYIGALREELAYETRLKSEVEALNQGIAEAASPREVLALRKGYLEATAAHFRRRGSVLAFCGLLNELHDRLVAKGAELAAQRLKLSDQGEVPDYALFVTGDRGRAEQTLKGADRYFLVHDEPTPRVLLFKDQLSRALKDLGLPVDDQSLWHGTLQKWRDYLEKSFQQAPSSSENFLAILPFSTPPKGGTTPPLPSGAARLAELADLMLLQGESSLAAEALADAAHSLRLERSREPFQQLVRRSVLHPTALGRFGRWRVEREGEHKGELNLQELALDPLVMTLRALTLHEGIEALATVDRIHRLLEKGALDVELAGKLLKAYQEIMQHKISRELKEEAEGCYLNPEELTAQEAERLKSAIEAVSNLQKICYQRMVG